MVQVPPPMLVPVSVQPFSVWQSPVLPVAPDCHVPLVQTHL